MPILRAYRRYRWVMVSGFHRVGGERVGVFRHGHAAELADLYVSQDRPDGAADIALVRFSSR